MRMVWLAALLAASSTVVFADNWSKNWAMSGTPELHVDAGDGSVSISIGSGGRIDAEITTRGWKIAPGEVTVTERQAGNRVDLEVHVPKVHGNYHDRQIRIEIRVPRDLEAFIHTGDGSIVMNGLNGKIQAATGDGSIEAADLGGTLEAHSGDGHIKVQGRLDNVNIGTGDGSIEAEFSPGSHMNADWRMQSGDGHVTVRLPRDFPLNLDARSGDGSVTVDMPMTVESVSKEHNEMRGKIDGGGQTLTIRTGDGSIHLQRS